MENGDSRNLNQPAPPICQCPFHPHKFPPLTLLIFMWGDWRQIVMETSANSGQPNRPPTAHQVVGLLCTQKALAKRERERERERESRPPSTLSPPLYSSVCPWPFRGMADTHVGRTCLQLQLVHPTSVKMTIDFGMLCF